MLACEIRPMPTYLELRQLMRRLPELLCHRYGLGAFYTAGQVQRAIEALAVRPALRVYGFAAACSLATFLDAVPGADDGDYHDLRSELADLAGLPTESFTMLHAERCAAAER